MPRAKMAWLLAALACTPSRTPDKAGETPADDSAAPVEDTGGGAAPYSDEADPVYDPDVLHEVEITLDPDDWESLRNQERSIYEMLDGDCLAAPWESPYTWFEAEVRYDGEDLGSVGLRKKGLMGSASTTRPSLRVDVDHSADGARYHGLEKLVFNNNNQDESRVRSCLAHAFFADAGLVAPRCSLAHVTVNGEDLGIYDNAEALDEDLIARRRGAEPTSLYEGRLSDFREGWLGSFEAKNDHSDGSELQAVADALELDDDQVLDALDAVVDLDAFYDYWAAEVIAGQWDGYVENTNNFYVYGDPEDGRLHFIAGGPDATWDSRSPFGLGQPVWVAAIGALPNRLIQIPEARSAYVEHLSALLDTAWKPEDRLARIDAWGELLHDETSRGERRALGDLREIVAAKQGDIEDGLGGRFTPPALRGDPCWSEIGSVSVRFSTTFGSYPSGDLYTEGEASTSYEISGVPYVSVQDGVTAGWADDQVLLLVMSQIADDTWIAPYVVFDPAYLADDTDVPVDGYAALAVLLYNSPETGGQWTTAAYLGDGSVSLDRASDAGGATISGSLSLSVLGSE